MRTLPLVALTLLLSGCATSPRRSRRGFHRPSPSPIARATDTAAAIPPGVTLDDGLTQDEAVAIALWNNADFRVQLTDLGFARADLLEAGLLQQSGPVAALSARPQAVRSHAALSHRSAVGAAAPRRRGEPGPEPRRRRTRAVRPEPGRRRQDRLCRPGAGARSCRPAPQPRRSSRRSARSPTARLRAGDISELEARSAAIDAARARQDAERADYEVTLRANALRGRLGLAADPAGAT